MTAKRLQHQPFTVNGPLELLPKELWTRVADGLSTASKISYYKCCVEFSSLLHPEKTLMLFPKVIPLITQCLGGKQLLSSRMVCKNWSKSVLEYIRDHPSQRPANNSRKICDNISLMTNLEKLGIHPVRFETAVGLKMFNKTMKGSLDPIPGSTVEIFLGKDEIFEYVFQGNQLFEAFGENVLYLIFNIEMSNNNMLVIYQTLRDWINLCPNVRSISIRGCFQRTNEYDGDYNEERNLRTLAVQVRVFGIEFGSNLETFMYDFKNLPSVISNEIFSSLESSVIKLKFPLDQWNSEVNRMFALVTDLEIENVISLVMLHDFVRANFPSNIVLQRLRLALQITLDWTDLLVMLKRVPVKCLEISRLSKTNNETPIPMLTNVFDTRISIERLEKLTIFDSIGLTYDFLINFPCLKYLHVNSDSENVVQFQNQLKCTGLRKLDAVIRKAVYNAIKPDFYLWLSLPSLEVFSVGTLCGDNVEVYARDVFIKRRIRVLVRPIV